MYPCSIIMDKKWESKLIPVLSDAVGLVANLLSLESSFLDKLVEKELLKHDQEQEIYSEREKSDKAAARRLFTVLKRLPSPSFDTFCDVLTEVQGQDLLNLLTKGEQRRRSSSSSTAEVQPPMHRSDVSNVSQAASVAGRRVKEDSNMQPFSETDSGAGHDGAKRLTISQVSLETSTAEKEVLDVFRLTVLDSHRTNVLSKKLAKDIGAIVTHMQIDNGLGRLSAQQYSVIVQQPSSREMARALLQAIWQLNVRATLRFFYAVYAVCPHILNEIEKGLKDQVCKLIADKVTQSGEFLNQFRPIEERLYATLSNLKKNRMTLLVVGKTGIGKSLLVKSLLGEFFAKKSVVTGECTAPVEFYADEFDKKEILVWDTPGLFDFEMQDIEFTDRQMARSQRYLERMKKIADVDLILFFVDAAASHLNSHAEDERKVTILTKAFTKDIWNHAIIVLAKANILTDLELVTRRLTSSYQDILHRCAGLSTAKAKSVPCLPVGSRDLVLANGRPWLPEVWITVAERTRKGANAVFIGWSTKRVKAVRSYDLVVDGKTIGLSYDQMRRMVNVISDLQLSDSSSISSIIVAVAVATCCGVIGFMLGGLLGTIIGLLVGAVIGFYVYIWRLL